jgi:hypothetical protein
MLSRNHSSLALPLALICPIPLILPIAVATHLLFDKFAGNIDEPKKHLRMEILQHTLFLALGLYCGVLLPVILAIICLNLPDLLKRVSSKIDLHNVYKFAPRSSLTQEGQDWFDVFGLLISAITFIAFVTFKMIAVI